MTKTFDEALSQLESIASIAQRAGLSSLATELREERIPALKSGTLSVVVLGEFNHGKSTLINALLGGAVLPVGITPTTAQITRVVYGAAGQARVSFTDGATVEVETGQLDEVVRDENDRVKDIVVQHPSPLLEEQVVIIDTPGVNDISKLRVEVTYGIVPRADVIVFVLDATQVLKRTELRFIEERLLSGLKERLVFVLGKVDRLDEEEGEEVIRYAKERLDAILGEVPLFPLSARRALRGQDEGVDRFKAWLEDYLTRRRTLILLDSALGAGLRASSSLLGTIRIKRQGYRLERQELQSKVEAVRDKLSASRRAMGEQVQRIERATQDVAAAAKSNVKAFGEDFANALPREVEKASVEDIKAFLPGFIQAEFDAFLTEEGVTIARNLDALAEEIIAITNENLREAIDTLNQNLGVDPDSVHVSVDSTKLDVSLFALGAFGVSILVFINTLVGGLITVAAPVIALVLKDRLEAQVKSRALAAGTAAIRAATERADQELVAMINDFGERLRRFVEDAGDQLYGQIEEALAQVLSEKAETGADREHLAQKARALEVEAAAIEAELSDARKALWESAEP